MAHSPQRLKFLAVLPLLAAVALGNPGVVVTHGGQRFEGEITERNDDVVVNIHGVQTTIPRDEIASLTYSLSFEKEWAARLGKLGPTDAAGRIELARWAMQQQHYLAARDALDAALAIDPNSREANDLRNHVMGQIRLNLRRAANAVPESAVPPSDIAAPEPGAGQLPMHRRLLSADEIQAIRRIEWRQNAGNTRLKIDPKSARAFAEYDSIPWREFVTRRPADQARLMLERGTPEHRAGVMILSDPPAISEFRRTVMPQILTGCGSAACHGGPSAGTFSLIAPADSEAAAYTNFYMLMSSTRKVEGGGAEGSIFGPAGTNAPLIARGNAEQSLLLQFALREDVSRYDHPRVAGYQPLFQNLADPRARPLIDWIKSLAPLMSDYGIRQTLPTASLPASQPAD